MREQHVGPDVQPISAQVLVQSPEQIASGARQAISLGASLVLVNCIDVQKTLPFVEALAAEAIPFGVYANAGSLERGIDPEFYVDMAEEWVKLGARVIGGCCGTGPEHIAALRRRFG